MSKASKCPVCDGRGKVHAGFYSMGVASTNAAPEVCRSCKGAGYVVVSDAGESKKKGRGILNG